LRDRVRARLSRILVKGRSDAVLLLLDAVLVVVAYLLILLGRFDVVGVPDWAWEGLRTFVPLAVGVHVVANLLARLYGPVWKQASMVEARRVLTSGAAATLALLLITPLFAERLLPLSVVLFGGGLATGLFGLVRFQSRLFALRRRAEPGGVRVLVVGAGDAAGSLLREIERHGGSSIDPVAIVDDDVRKQGRRLCQIPIVGGIDDLEEAARTLEIDQVLLAIPSADSHLVRRVADVVRQLDLPLKILPGVDEMVNGRPRAQDVRDLSIDDLLGRQQIKTDLAAVAAMIEGRRVLVTGGGGSIGSEIARQVARYRPARLVLLDRDETHLFDAAATVDGCVEVLLDIRDRGEVEELFARERPEIVFHAAANKHVPLLESHPREAATTNVLGTRNLVDAARTAGVEHLVFISTDKAVRPSSVMGASKRVGEQLVLAAAPADSAWCAVRFGNVLGSRGSVVPTFVRQIRQGGPVTITHPEMTRFFMSIPEAVQLVLQAAALAERREIFMLEMGEAVRILDLAHRMISLAGYEVGEEIEVQVTGLRPGEKLAEELHTPEERPSATAHPKILRLEPVRAGTVAVDEVIARLAVGLDERDDAAVRAALFDGLSAGRAEAQHADVARRGRLPEQVNGHGDTHHAPTAAQLLHRSEPAAASNGARPVLPAGVAGGHGERTSDPN
jgi:FlaA1/EpsC-like NDP-sugar epimerase